MSLIALAIAVIGLAIFADAQYSKGSLARAVLQAFVGAMLMFFGLVFIVFNFIFSI